MSEAMPDEKQVADKIFEVPVEKIIVPPDRQRKEFTDIESLAVNIYNIGQIYPLVVDESYKLIAGERRLRAIKRLGLPTVKVIFQRDTDDETKREIEIEENLQRKQFTWQEEVKAKAELYAIQQRKYGASVKGFGGGFGLKEGAQMMQESIGKLHGDLTLAKALSEYPELANAKNKSTALKKYKNMREKELVKELNKRAGNTISAADVKLVNGDCRHELKALEDESIDLVFTDPPYGKDITTISKENAEHVYDDNSYEIMDMLDLVFKECYRVLRQNRNMVVWFDMQHYQQVYNMLTAAGFTVYKHPLIWIKGGSNFMAGQGERPALGYETAFLCAKGARPMNRKGINNYFAVDKMPPAQKNHPFQKPGRLLRDIIDAFTLPGETVADPFCGGGSIPIAALECKRKAWGCELDKDFYEAALFAVNEKASSNNESFEGLKPGTPEWIDYWSQHPEQQSEMLEYKKRITKGKEA